MYIIIIIFILASINFSKVTQGQLVVILHIFAYIILGLRLRQVYKSSIIWISSIAIIAVLDELYQWVLPYRTADITDVTWNILGGILGGLLGY